MLNVIKKIQKWIDVLTTAVSSVLLAVMFCVLVANVVLRLIPSIGGFKWYMEFSQYANVWAMLIGAAGVAVKGTNLRVEAMDGIYKKIPYGEKISKIIVDLALILFYYTMIKSGSILSQKAVQKVSTMPQFKMGQVYRIFPVAGVICIIAVLVNLFVTILDKEGTGEEEKGGIAS